MANERRASKMCPTCRSGKLHRSQMRGFMERGVLRNLGIRAFRCEECDERFYRFGGDQESGIREPRRSKELGRGV
jgi:hypothetical protein